MHLIHQLSCRCGSVLQNWRSRVATPILFLHNYRGLDLCLRCKGYYSILVLVDTDSGTACGTSDLIDVL